MIQIVKRSSIARIAAGRRPTRLGVLVTLIAVAGYGVVIEVSGAGRVWGALTQLGIASILVIAFLSLLNYALRSLRWRLYLKRLGYRLHPGTNMLCYLSGFAFTLTPGKAGEAGRGVHLKAYGVDYQATVAALLVERLMDLVAVVLLALAAVAILPGFRWIIAAAAGVTVAGAAGLFVLSRQRATGPASGGRQRWWARARARVQETLRLIGPLLAAETLAVGAGLSLLAWGCEAFGFYWLCAHLDIPLSLLTAAGIYATSLLAGALSFLPGGLGTTEAAMTGLLMALGGIGQSLAVGTTLICRVLTLWLAIALGIACNLYLETPLAPRSASEGI